MNGERENVRAAIQAASLAGHYEVAIEIAQRVGLLDQICIGCAASWDDVYDGPMPWRRPDVVFEAVDGSVKISTCEDCTEAFARWVALGKLQRWLSEGALRTGVENLQRRLNASLDWIANRGAVARAKLGGSIIRNLEVDGQVGPRTLQALQTVSAYRNLRDPQWLNG